MHERPIGQLPSPPLTRSDLQHPQSCPRSRLSSCQSAGTALTTRRPSPSTPSRYLTLRAMKPPQKRRRRNKAPPPLCSAAPPRRTRFGSSGVPCRRQGKTAGSTTRVSSWAPAGGSRPSTARCIYSTSTFPGASRSSESRWAPLTSFRHQLSSWRWRHVRVVFACYPALPYPRHRFASQCFCFPGGLARGVGYLRSLESCICLIVHHHTERLDHTATPTADQALFYRCKCPRNHRPRRLPLEENLTR